jgi:hypothetical protein
VKGEWRRRCTNVVDGLHTHMQNRMMKPRVIALNGVERGVKGGRWWDDLINVQCKPIQNCHNESLLYSEYILIKMKKKTRKD